MKILHIISTFPPAYAFGGPPKVAFDVCRELAKRGHEVEVYSTNAYDQRSNFTPPNRTLVLNNVKVTYFPNWVRINNLFIAPGMITEMRKKISHFDVVHIHFGRQIYDTYTLFLKKMKVPLVFQAHGTLPHMGNMRVFQMIYDSIIGRKIFLNASKVVALSWFEAEQYRRMGVPDEKIAIIPNGIDLAEYAVLPPKGCFKRKFGIPEEKKIILYLGRIHRTKGIDFLIKAYAHLTKKIGVKDTVLVIAGPDDGYLNYVNSLSRSLSVSNFVLFTGPLYGEAKLEAFVDSEAYVLPSRYETFPMSLLEAYACLKPVIASKVDGLKELIRNDETGLFFEVGNFRRLAERTFELLNDESKALEMGLKGRKFVEEKFSIEKVVGMLEKVYEETAGWRFY